MLLHEEGKAVPHPERPDRLRAIMARLVGNGLAGAACRKPLQLRCVFISQCGFQLVSCPVSMVAASSSTDPKQACRHSSGWCCPAGLAQGLTTVSSMVLLIA
jgi:hypothetical protein